MKKKVLKVVAGATLVAAMVVSLQLNEGSSSSDIALENIEAIAIAGSGESGSNDCRWNGKKCTTDGTESVCVATDC
jgi:hypothetical protein